MEDVKAPAFFKQGKRLFELFRKKMAWEGLRRFE